MRLAGAAAAGALTTWAIITLTSTPDIQYETEVIERTVVDEKLTTIDLEQLRHQVDDLNEQLDDECVLMIARRTGDPEAGIRHHVDRHYDGDACKAAEEAMSGDW
ncbi:MAG TPA: hypothetical protein VIG24_02890 [Acidimicrobiia bacterium]